jgi:WD40 repeat protein
VVSGCKGGEILRWDAQADPPVYHRVIGNSAGFGFLPDSNSVVSLAGDGRLTFVDLNAGRAPRYRSGPELLHPETAVRWAHEPRVGVSPDGGFVAVTVGNGEIAIVKRPAGLRQEEVVSSVQGERVLRFTDDGKMLATLDYAREVVEIWSTDSWELLHQVPFDPSIRVTAAGVSGDGRMFALGGRWGSLRVGSIARPDDGFVVRAHRGMITECVFSPENRLLVTGATDGKVFAWDVNTGALVKRLAGHLVAVTALTFSADGQRLATAIGDGDLKLWKVAGEQQLLRLNCGGQAIRRVRFSGDGTMLGALADNGELHVWWVSPDRQARDGSGGVGD